MARFSSIGLSDPQYESDGLRFITFYSPALQRRGDVSVFVPRGCEDETNLPVALLLHGVYGSHWAWSMSGGAHKAAQGLIDSGAIRPMVLVMPSDGLWNNGSGYLKHEEADYEAWIVEDVRDGVTQAIPQVGEQSAWSIAGLSMGGYGALRLGAKYAERFAAVSGHSSITHLNQIPLFIEIDTAAYGKQDAEDVDVGYWIEAHRDRLPPLRFDCGVEDELIEANRALHARLEGTGIAHEYMEFTGDHSWPYWAEHIADTLRFFDSAL